MDAKKTIDELLENIAEATNGLDMKEKFMVLCTVGEHCRAYAETILSHEYHMALYGRREASEW